MFQTIGVCGTGNMGRAIVKGLVAAHAIAADHIYLYNIHKEKAEALAKETGAVVVDTPEELARQSQGLIMAVKPNIMELALEAVRESLPADSVLISIAAGISLTTRMSTLAPYAAALLSIALTTRSLSVAMPSFSSQRRSQQTCAFAGTELVTPASQRKRVAFALQVSDGARWIPFTACTACEAASSALMPRCGRAA